ncbi:glycoside hydrolase family 114 protein [Botryobasidium botryosum FD-172 SS1]|uniref:alpha-galactosidase n=1 Tax=Botryobasidium botryosum (strain FD-172 SS1) TaxID=930990 RepID=A0A067MSZ7_BOTB1|nr:glycoside hydrolase family 114 protein [Botryobasidium botryosum FD-172 SS1]
MKGHWFALLALAAGTHAAWTPAKTATFTYQIGSADISRALATPSIQLVFLDGFDTPASTVKQLHDAGKKAICYLSAGSYEDWRSDKASFPAAVLGKALDGWAGEKWLDVRQLSVLEGIMGKRADLCVQKGFDGIDWDNVDGYTNATGFPLTAANQLAYNKLLASIAHARGLAVGLKNDLDQVKSLVGDFDWVMDEECVLNNECDLLTPFLTAGKPVFGVEYPKEDSSLSKSTPAKICATPNKLGFTWELKNIDLDPVFYDCKTATNYGFDWANGK